MHPGLAPLVTFALMAAGSPGVDCPAAPAGDDWTGRYEAGEAVNAEGFAPQVMSYRIDVFRDAAGAWRAFVWITGQTTFQELSTCGVAGPRTLKLRGRPARAEEDDDSPAADVLTIERTRRGRLNLRFPPDGSYLQGKPFLEADRRPLPPWAGVYQLDTCAADAAAVCWRYRFEVGPGDDGWRVDLSVDGPDTTERLVARGEDYELAGGAEVLDLTFVRPGAGDARRGEARPRGQSIGKLTRRKDGSTWVRLDGVPGPTGLGEARLTADRPR
jgi:hypothetical protein